jgi:hypothetical protein
MPVEAISEKRHWQAAINHIIAASFPFYKLKDSSLFFLLQSIDLHSLLPPLPLCCFFHYLAAPSCFELLHVGLISSDFNCNAFVGTFVLSSLLTLPNHDSPSHSLSTYFELQHV